MSGEAAKTCVNNSFHANGHGVLVGVLINMSGRGGREQLALADF